MYIGNKVVRSLIRKKGGDLKEAWQAASVGQEDFRKLKILSLGGCSTLSSLTPLSELRQLRVLNLQGCTAISDLQPVSELKELTQLILEGCSNVSSIDPLHNLTRLRVLMLGAPADLSPLASLQSLEQLHLHYGAEETTDLSPLASMRSLELVCNGRGNLRLRISKELQENPERVVSVGVRRAIQQLARERRPRKR